MTLGTYIAERRKGLNLSVRQVADTAGVPWQRLANLETGRVKSLPGPDELRAIAAALGVTPRDLLVAAGYLDAES